MMLITSRQNKILQHVRKLQQSKAYRVKSGQFVADGTKLFDEALKWWPGLELVIAAESVALPPLPEHIKEYRVPADLMQWLSQMEAPQGVIFVGRRPEVGDLTLEPGCLILDGIQDPGNLGTILRTADALEVPVILSDGCADPWSDKTVRATMGAVFRTVPQTADKQTIIAACREKNIPLAVTALSDTSVDIRTADLSACAVVIGSEGRGICEDYARAAQQQLIIPMNPRCESLNAAVAATIVMWQMRR